MSCGKISMETASEQLVGGEGMDATHMQRYRQDHLQQQFGVSLTFSKTEPKHVLDALGPPTESRTFLQFASLVQIFHHCFDVVPNVK
jgi:hypothetical protein